MEEHSLRDFENKVLKCKRKWEIDINIKINKVRGCELDSTGLEFGQVAS
jgi:hypothetical protein